MIFSQLADNLAGSCQTAFGESVTYTPAGGSPVEIEAIYDENHVVIEGGAEVGVETFRPAISVRLSDFSDLGFVPKRHDLVTVRGTIYEVVELEADGEAEVLLVLMRAADA